MNHIQQQFKDRLSEDELHNCMKCGFCLPSCPTYIESGYKESHSPRGRIAIMKAVSEGLIDVDEDVEKSLSLCLGCRACEPVCPPGVNYGQLLEDARDIITQNKKHSLFVKGFRKFIFSSLFPSPSRMRNIVALLGVYQRWFQKICRNIGVLKLLPTHLQITEKVLPAVPSFKEMKDGPTSLSPLAPTQKSVAFFSGCLMNTMFLATNSSTLTLLQQTGCDVNIPNEQVCCGALHAHGGEKGKAKELARKNIAAFEKVPVDSIISNAGGCGAFLREYDHLLKDDPDWSKRAHHFVQKINDISTHLVHSNYQEGHPLSLPEQTITYQDSCHLRNVMKVSEEPRALLKYIIGIDYKEMNGAGSCCGSAGIYNLLEPKMASDILDAKMKNVKAVNPTTIVTSNPGCLLQMKIGIEREGLSEHIRVVHLADILVEASVHSSVINKTTGKQESFV
ncbi:(Fe-S)-binding protein [Bacillus alkalicellulosilyticus]|uniref:(Fe-S)-binding protein n=1 Tax=Alkalihalobacterium alkalicellulosilyticum TaxID=1912214 RepID=UPI000998B495|nr:(Fe-S)-binding protein [Bacillus alkalicellulosilyticus]